MAWNVLILGGGFGGLYAARKLERALPPHAAKVTVVTDVNFMLYTPLLPGAGAGTLEPRHVVVPLREHLKRTDLLLGRVTGADPDNRKVFVTTAEGQDRALEYDQLIITLGSVSRTLPVPGLKKYAVGFKTLSDAIALRNQIIHMGHQKAVAETAGIKWRGFPAWFLARTYHLAMMPGTSRKLRLVVDWTVDLLFGRDTSELGQLGHPPVLDATTAGGTSVEDSPAVRR